MNEMLSKMSRITKRLLILMLIILSITSYGKFHTTSDIEQVTSMPDTSAWTGNMIPASTELGSQFDIQACTDGSGGLILAWKDTRDDSGDIYAQRVDSNGNPQWNANGTVICNSIGEQENPEIATDDAGGAIIVWEDHRSGTTYIYAQRIDSTGAVQWAVNGIRVSTGAGFEARPDVCPDGTNGAIVCWGDYRTSWFNIYAQKLNSAGTRVWASAGLSVATMDSRQWFSRIISDNIGGAIISWEDQRGGTYDIYAERIDMNGNALWSSGNGTAVCSASGDQRYISMCSDDNYGAFISWADKRSSSYWDIYCAKITGAGSKPWTANGVHVCSASYTQFDPRLAHDTSGGVYVAWEDGRAGSTGPYDVYAQYIDNTGATQWPYNGIAICDEEGDQDDVLICPDGTAGAIIAWDDGRPNLPTSSNIFYQRVNSTGDSLWGRQGSCVYDDELRLSTSVLVADDVGTALVACGTTSGADVYACRVKKPPEVENGEDLEISATGSETLSWKVISKESTGQYQVHANDSNGDDYIYQTWSSWINDTAFETTINKTWPGTYYYYLEAYDTESKMWSRSVDIIIEIEDLNPTTNTPADIAVSINEFETITWNIDDDFGGGWYRIVATDLNGNPYTWMDWQQWQIGEDINVPINRNTIGTFNYTIEYNTTTGQESSDLVTVVISATSGPGGIVGTMLEYLPYIIGGLAVLVSLIAVSSARRSRKMVKNLQETLENLEQKLPETRKSSVAKKKKTSDSGKTKRSKSKKRTKRRKSKKSKK